MASSTEQGAAKGSESPVLAGIGKVIEGAQTVKQSTGSKKPIGSFTATGASVGSIFGPAGTTIGGIAGAIADLVNVVVRPRTAQLGWSVANDFCGPIADKVTAELKTNLTQAQFSKLASEIEDRAIQQIKAREKGLQPADFVTRVVSFVNDINSTRGALSETDTVRTTIWRNLMQRAQFYARADYDADNGLSFGREMYELVNALVYAPLRREGAITSLSPFGGESKPGSETPADKIGSFLEGKLVPILLIGALFGFVYFYKGAK